MSGRSAFDVDSIREAIQEHVEQEEKRWMSFDSMKHSIHEVLGGSSDEPIDAEMRDAAPPDYTQGYSSTLNQTVPRPTATSSTVIPEPEDVAMEDASDVATLGPENGSVTPKRPQMRSQGTDPATPVSSPSSARRALSSLNTSQLGAKSALIRVRRDSLTENGHAEADTSQELSQSLGAPVSAQNPNNPDTVHVVLPMPTPSWIAKHDNVPYVLSTYLQLLFNATVLALAVYLGTSVLKTFWRDVDSRLSELAMEHSIKASRCSVRYLANNCSPDRRAPALEELCEELENCMNNDAPAISRLKVSAEVIADIVNGFLETFSRRAIAVSAVLILGTMFVSNYMFGYIRATALYKKPRKQGLLRHPPRTNGSIRPLRVVKKQRRELEPH